MLRRCFALFALAGFLAPVVAAEPTSAPNPGGASPDPKSLAVPPQELSKARELVHKLGSESYTDRETAERDLAAMGRLARAAILDAVNNDPDPEVRARCNTLLPKATQEEMKARLASFKADTEGKYDHDLPGWHQLRATVRGEMKLFGWKVTARPTANMDKAARELYIEFMEAPGGRQLLQAMNVDATTLGQHVSARKQELYNARFPRNGTAGRALSAAEVGVCVFAESQVNSRLVPRSMLISNVITNSSFWSALQGNDDKATALKAIMNAWFDSRNDGQELYTAFSLAQQLGNNDARGRLATKLVLTPGVPVYYRTNALSVIVSQKMNDQLPTLEKAFNDTTTVATTIGKDADGKQVRKTVEMRDAALAAALLVTGQDPNDYGFDSFPKGINFTPTYCRLSEEKRKEAFEKWEKWREKNP